MPLRSRDGGAARRRPPVRPSCVHAAAANDCGPASLASVCRAFGHRVLLADVRRLAGTDVQGTSLAALRDAAVRLGFHASSGRATAGIGELPKPAILHLLGEQAGHFVVLFSVRRRRALVADPSIGLVRVSTCDLSARWTGAALLLAPGPNLCADFIAKKRRPSMALGWLRTEWRAILLCALLSLAAWCAAVGLSRITGTIVDSLATPSAWSDWEVMAWFGAATVVGAAAFVLLRSVLLAFLACRVERSLGRHFAHHVLALPIRTFDRLNAGDVTARLFDIDAVGGFAAGAALSAAIDSVALLATGVALLMLDPKLAVIAIASAAPVAAAGVFGARAFERRERELRVLTSRMTSGLMDLLLNIKVVKMYAFENRSSHDLARMHGAAKRGQRDQGVCQGWIAGIGGLSGGAATLAIVLVGTRMAAAGRGTVGQLVFFMGIAGLFIGVAAQVVPSLLAFSQARVAAGRLDDLFARETESPVSAGLNGGSGSLTLCDVSFAYGGSPVLASVSLALTPGEAVCILGETGCGKTTLACLLAGLLEPQAGRISSGGERSAQPASLRSRTLVVFQEHGLLQGSVRHNILLGLTARENEIRSAAESACANEFIRKLPGGYDYLVGPGGGLLSSGQRQRIALARALLRNPEVLVLDEATSNLDSETELRILGNIRRARAGLVTVFITHRLTTALRCDRILVLGGGAIVQEGSHRELIEKPGPYRRLWKAYGVEPGSAAAEMAEVR